MLIAVPLKKSECVRMVGEGTIERFYSQERIEAGDRFFFFFETWRFFYFIFVKTMDFFFF